MMSAWNPACKSNLDNEHFQLQTANTDDNVRQDISTFGRGQKGHFGCMGF